MPETTPLIKAALNLRVGVGFDVYHSSINVTEIYTHVTTAKQRDILISKHPRKDFHI